MNISSFLSYTSLITTFVMTIATSSFGQRSSYSHRTTDDNGHKISVKTPLTSFEIEYEGELTISDDDKDIIAISDGGFFELKKKTFGSRRRILIDSDGSGQLSKKYYIGRREQSYEPDGRKWLADILPDVLRTTTLGAESRVKRFYDKGGVAAVLDEISQIEGDYGAAHYYGILLDYDVSDTELAQVIDMAGNTLDSDHYLSNLLRENRDQFLKNDATIYAYIEASGSLDSDHYLSEVLRDAIDDGDINQKQIDALLSITSNIDSDHYISEVLRELITTRDLDDPNLKKALQLSESIDSDHYKTEVIKQVMRTRKNIDDQMLVIVLDGMEDIESDHYATEIIKDLYHQDLTDEMVAKVLSYTANEIDSDHYTTESLHTILKRYDIGEESFVAVIDALDDIGSDHYVNEVIKKIGSEDSLSEAQLIELLELIGDMGSDHYMAEALKSLSGRVNECGSEVTAAYRKAARNINSETYYGRALRAIER